MKDEVSRLTYYDGTNFYFMLGNKVNCINVEAKQLSYYVDHVSLDHVYVSDDMQVMAYDSSDQAADNATLTLVNFATIRWMREQERAWSAMDLRTGI